MDYYKYQDQDPDQKRVQFQWFLEVVNREVKIQQIDEPPVELPEVRAYMLNSQRSHKAFRLYLWACQLAAQFYPDRYNMPAAFIPVNHDQKAWLDDVQARYEEAVVGLVLLDQFDDLHLLLQRILNDEPVFQVSARNFSGNPPQSPFQLWLQRYLMLIQSMPGNTRQQVRGWLHPPDGRPRLTAVEAAIMDYLFVRGGQVPEELKSGFGAYCRHAEMPVLNQDEHQLLHDWHEVWRAIRMQCGKASDVVVTPPCLAHGCTAQQLIGALAGMWPNLQLSKPFQQAQQAAGYVFGLSTARVEALLRRIQLSSRSVAQSDIAAHNLEQLRQWFYGQPGSSNVNDYASLALFAGMLNQGDIYVFEFPGRFFPG